MKRLLLLFLTAVLAAGLISYAEVPGDRKKAESLSSLWMQYEKALENDQIQKMAAILEDIKGKALKERRAWDYYKACLRYASAKAARNWKLYEECLKNAKEEIHAYGEPVLDYLINSSEMNTEQKLAFLDAYGEVLRSRRNVDVYQGEGTMFPEVLIPTIENDFQFILWDLLAKVYCRDEGYAAIYERLEDNLDGEYPQAGIAEFIYRKNTSAQSGSDVREGLEDMARRYDGKALGIMIDEHVITAGLNDRDFKGTSEYYIALKERVGGLIKERDSFRDPSEKILAGYCTGLEKILKHLDAQVAEVTVRDGVVSLLLRNIDELKIKVWCGRKLAYETMARNDAGSYFVYDTLAVELPDLDDGEYKVECHIGSEKLGGTRFSKYTLSAAVRQDAEGMALYVADYMTGEPVETVDVILYGGDRKLAEEKDMSLHGFTSLPSSIVDKMAAGTYGYSLVCVMRDSAGIERRSAARRLYRAANGVVEQDLKVYAKVMLDRPAYNPDEQVRFKAVMFQTAPDGTVATVPAGQAYEARLVDMNEDVLESAALTSNDFGSVAGGFSLSQIKRNGRHSVCLYQDDMELARTSFIVDEYVLPTFDVTFDAPEKVFYAGDDIVVRGQLKSYTGHSLSAAEVSARVELYGDLIYEGTVVPGSDGAFEISFKDADDQYHYGREYSIEVKVTDLTGETQSFFHHQPVMTDPYLACELKNSAEGECCLHAHKGEIKIWMLDEDMAQISCEAGYEYGMMCPGLPLKYKVLKGDEVIMQGDVVSGDVAELDFSGLASGLYEFVLSMEAVDSYGNPVVGEAVKNIFRLPSDGSEIRVPESVENVFQVLDGDDIMLRIGAGNGPVWAVVELFGDSRQLLKSELLFVEKGGMKTLDYDYLSEYPDGVVMNVAYFRKGDFYKYSHIWRRPVSRVDVPLEFTRFTDAALPGARCTVAFRSLPGVEAVASVYDVATDRMLSNPWRTVHRSVVSVSMVDVQSANGRYGRSYPAIMGDAHKVYESDVVVAYGSRRKANRTGRAEAVQDIAVHEDEAIPFQMVESKAGFVETAWVNVRDSFSPALAFEPFLYPDEDGVISFEFDASDKLSTYVVSVFAHDKEMNNAVVRKEMTVTLPVKLSVVQPQYLHEGDAYILKASVSSMSSEDVAGDMILEVYSGGTYEGRTPLARYVAEDLGIAAGGSAAESFEVAVPSCVDTLGFKVVFAAGDFSDGMFVKVPVHPADQVIRETHSAVLLKGMSEEDLVNKLRGRFVNGSSIGAEYSAVSALDMLKASLPLVVEAESKDAVSQSEAVFVNLLAAGLRKAEGENVDAYVAAARTAMEKVAACVNEDGGLAWFEGMKSSPTVTAVVLHRFSGLRDRGLLVMLESDCEGFVSNAVRYLDSVYFGDSERPVWYGGLSLSQYLAVRAMYAHVPFDEAEACNAVGAKGYRQFRSAVKDFLVPATGKGLFEGYILGKVRMLGILSDLMSSKAGMRLAGQWGVSGLNGSRMRRSMIRELNSLKEYAVEHPSGGVYYPNAVMPWRGLLESEAYAHAVICDLFRDLSSDPDLGAGLAELADGIRLWIMLQKETQAWSADCGFVEAMASVYDASDAVKDTRVVVLSKRFLKPFAEIKESGNGFNVSVAYYRDGKELQEGDTLTVGDKITARYSLWSEENRSFVRLSVPRAACMRPVDQLSGWTWGWFRPLGYGIFSVTPYSYREVKADRTLYWMDVFPEEKSTIEEELFVTQAGVYTCPVAEIESLYAPHYRANDGFGGMIPKVVGRNI